jgi:hypothetical protein
MTSLSITIDPPRPPHTYLGVAESILPGIQVLASQTRPPAIPATLLAAHMLECLLKAYLSRNGDDKRLLVGDMRHNIAALWQLASREGINLPAQLPTWASTLSHLHDRPFYLRYSTGVNGVVTPPIPVLARELENMLKEVSSQIRGT